MAQFEFKLPDIGEGVVEGEIVKWLVKPGDQIVEDQPLVEVMTDKATVTIPSPRRGTVVKTVGKEGDVAKVHSTLVVLELEGGGAAQATPSTGVPAQAAPALPPEQAGQPAHAELLRPGQAQLSYLPFIAQALLRGFARCPELSALMDDEKQALVVKQDVNLGFGAATPQGLTVFVVKDVRSRTIPEIGAEIDRLAKAAREQKLQLNELQGSTFTVTSLGRDGGLMATPVVKHPEVGILGVHKIKEYAKPTRLASGQVHVEVAERMNLSCSFDHRVIDGHIGAAFLYEVIRA